jgi:predicted amino acid-binding ACT domain protein
MCDKTLFEILYLCGYAERKKEVSYYTNEIKKEIEELNDKLTIKREDYW